MWRAATTRCNDYSHFPPADVTIYRLDCQPLIRKKPTKDIYDSIFPYRSMNIKAVGRTIFDGKICLTQGKQYVERSFWQEIKFICWYWKTKWTGFWRRK